MQTWQEKVLPNVVFSLHIFFIMLRLRWKGKEFDVFGLCVCIWHQVYCMRKSKLWFFFLKLSWYVRYDVNVKLLTMIDKLCFWTRFHSQREYAYRVKGTRRNDRQSWFLFETTTFITWFKIISALKNNSVYAETNRKCKSSNEK